ncbi:hypothetical protein V8E36_002252 [Tilletia maclaganii]
MRHEHRSWGPMPSHLGGSSQGRVVQYGCNSFTADRPRPDLASFRITDLELQLPEPIISAAQAPTSIRFDTSRDSSPAPDATLTGTQTVHQATSLIRELYPLIDTAAKMTRLAEVLESYKADLNVPDGQPPLRDPITRIKKGRPPSARPKSALETGKNKSSSTTIANYNSSRQRHT